MSATTTAAPTVAEAEAYLDENAILSLSIAAAAMHTLAELLGTDTMGYATLQLGIAAATRPCATAAMRKTFERAIHVLSPGHHWSNESSEVPIAAPAVVLLASVVVHYLVTLFVGACAALCCRDDDDDEDDAEDPDRRRDGGGERNPEPADPYGGGFWKVGARLLRWPFWSVTLVRLSVVPCSVYAVLQLGRGNRAPPGSGDEELSQGVAASGAVLATAVMIVLIGSVILTHRFVERMRPKWIFFGGSGRPERRDVASLPCNGLLLADGFWSDHGHAFVASAAVAGAGRSQPKVIAACVLAPIVTLVIASFIGGPWELVDGETSDTCITPFAVSFGLLITCGVIPVIVLRPYRHAGANLLAVLRLLSLSLFLLTRIVPDDQMPQAPFTGIFFATEVVTSFVSMCTGILERIVWRPAEAEVRTVRLRYLMLVGRVMRAIDARFGAGTPEAEAAKRAVPNADVRVLRDGGLLDAATVAEVDAVDWREGDAPNEVAIPDDDGPVQLARRHSAMLTAPTGAAATPGIVPAPAVVTARAASANPLETSGRQPSVSGEGPPPSRPPIVFSPSSPHPIPRRDGSVAAVSASPARAMSPLPAPGIQEDADPMVVDLPGGGNPEAASLFLEMDILTAAISRFESEPAAATAARIRDPFSPSGLDQNPAQEGRGLEDAAGSSPLRPQRSVRFDSNNRVEELPDSSSVIDAPAASSPAGARHGGEPPRAPIQFTSSFTTRDHRADDDDDPDL